LRFEDWTRSPKYLAPSGKSLAYPHHRKNSKARVRKLTRAFSIGRESRPGSMIPYLRAAAISAFRAPCERGNRNEQTTCCHTDRRIIHFVRSKSPRSCRRCCVGRGVGSGGFGTGGRGGRGVHWIYRGTRDRAFVGSRTVHIAIAGSACDAIKPRNATTSLRQGNFAAGCQTSRNGCRRKGRATRSGI
jgi:hypothetical protein